ncbi:MAG: hypothetical protein ACKPKO_21945, partial [Candidatus Fonsibacter sp.]
MLPKLPNIFLLPNLKGVRGGRVELVLPQTVDTMPDMLGALDSHALRAEHVGHGVSCLLREQIRLDNREHPSALAAGICSAVSAASLAITRRGSTCEINISKLAFFAAAAFQTCTCSHPREQCAYLPLSAGSAESLTWLAVF